MGEQRFKVGDWVRVKDNRGAPLDYKVGDVCQVSAVRDDLVFSNKKPGMFAKRFEPWQPRVGERVRIVNPRHDFKCGHKGREFTVAEQQESYEGEPAFVGCPESRPYIWTTSELEPVAAVVATTEQPATLKIEAGKFYKTRDGRKVGPIVVAQGRGEPWPWKSCYGWNTYYLKEDGFSCPGSIHNHRDADDLIAEWIDEPVAKPSNDNAKPKFKVGDRVKRFRGNNPGSKVGHEATISKIEDISGWDEDGPWLKFEDGTSGYATSFNFVAATPATTTIVALIENGQPKPSSTPHVHASTGAAEKEAKRLAAKYKGKQFSVFTLTTTHEEAAPVFDHKWQNMAALGLKIDAIKELRAVAGLTLKGARDAVEAWIEYENAA